MRTQVTTIATAYYTSITDVFDVEKLLNVTVLPVEYETVFVTLVVMHQGEWEEHAFELNGGLYVRLVISPTELRFEDISVLAKDHLRNFLQTAEIEQREPAWA